MTRPTSPAARTVRAVLAAASVLLAALAVLVMPLGPAHAAGTTYYVGSTQFPCNDTFAGTDPQKPWCNLTRASGAYGPGDQILIARGTRYPGQQLIITGQGAVGAPITIAPYGTGARPAISWGGPNGPDKAGKALVWLKNPSNITVTGLELSDAGAGVLAQYSPDFPGSVTGNQNLTFTDLVVHHIGGVSSGGDQPCQRPLGLWRSAGVGVTGPFPTYDRAASGVTIRDVEGYHNDATVLTGTCIPSSTGHPLLADVTIDNVRSYAADGAGYAGHCGPAMFITEVIRLRITNSYIDGSLCRSDGDHKDALLMNGTVDTSVSHNLIAGSVGGGGGVHSGVGDGRFDVHNNVFVRNERSGLAFACRRPGPSGPRQVEATGNAIYANQVSLLAQCSSEDSLAGTVARNLTADGVFAAPGATWDPAVPDGADNIIVAAGTVPDAAAASFSRTQAGTWSYQTTSNNNDPAAWRTATYVENPSRVEGYWTGPGGGRISRFEQQAGACTTCASARVWTAPADGTIAVRSRAFKTRPGGSWVIAGIWHNTTLATARRIDATDLTGAELNTQLTVKKGDTLRFVLNFPPATTDDWTSWAPAIGYLPVKADSTTGAPADPGFETPRLPARSYRYNPTGSPWTFTGQAGLAANGSAFNNPGAPDDQQQVAFLQGTGQITQTISGLRAGVGYTLDLALAKRPGGAQTVQVLLDGQIIKTITPDRDQFASYPITFTGSTGVHTLTFRGTVAADVTAFLDITDITNTADQSGATNYSFETTDPGPGRVDYGSTTGWTATATGTGKAGWASNGSPLGNPDAPHGTQVGVLTGVGTSTLTNTTLRTTPGRHNAVLFSAAVPVDDGSAADWVPATVVVTVDGTEVGRYTPTSATWHTYAVPIPPSTSTQPHTIAFTATGTAPVPGNPDPTVFIDDIRVAPGLTPFPITNNTFTQPRLPEHSHAYAPTMPGWTGQPLDNRGSGSGLATADSGFTPPVPAGAQVAFIQRDATLATTPGAPRAGHAYLVSLQAVQRRLAGRLNTQTIRVEVDGVPVHTFTAGPTWTDTTFLVDLPPGAPGRITLIGTAPADDNTAFIGAITAQQL